MKVDSDELFQVLKVLYDERSVATLERWVEDKRNKKEKTSFAEIKKEFLKGAAKSLGEAATSAVTKGLLALVVG